MSNIQVSAIDTTNSKVVQKTKTNSNGSYELNVPEGTYIIIFNYDNNEYTVTTYKVNGSDEDENSDVIEKQMLINGNEVTVGVTDTLEVNSDLANIDIGLIK